MTIDMHSECIEAHTFDQLGTQDMTHTKMHHLRIELPHGITWKSQELHTVLPLTNTDLVLRGLHIFLQAQT